MYNPSFEKDDINSDYSSAEKFFTFQKKNEEFQKLLDREYERINRIEGRQEEVLQRPNIKIEDIDIEDEIEEET